MDVRTIHSADYSQPKQEKYINPYTDFGFQKLFDQAEIARYSESERRQYEESRKDYWDYYSTVTTAEKKGRAEGLAEGMEKGRAEGRAEERLKNARNLKKNGVPVDVIAVSLGLTEEEIAQLS